jgi:hypothetical protein
VGVGRDGGEAVRLAAGTYPTPDGSSAVEQVGSRRQP